MNFFAVCILACVAFAQGKSDDFYTVYSPQSTLRKDLFKDYDSKVLPVEKNGDRVPVFMDLSPLYVRDLNEETEILELDTWIAMRWEDKHLVWDPAKYSGIKNLNIPSTDIWRPDITIYTGTPDIKLLPEVMTNVILYHNGSIMWVPPITVSSRCPLDHKNFPKDEQICEVVIGSWTLGSKSIDFQLSSDVPDVTNLINSNPKWSIEKSTVRREDKIYPCCPDESYASMHYSFTLKRKGSSEVCISTVLTSFGVLLGLLMFFVHPESSQKLILGAFGEILMTIVVLYLAVVIDGPAAKMKASERVFPFMAIVAVFMIAEMLVINLASLMESCRPPKAILILSRALSQPFSFCSKKYDDMSEEKKKLESSSREEWNIVASALDKIFLAVAIALIAVFSARL